MHWVCFPNDADAFTREALAKARHPFAMMRKAFGLQDTTARDLYDVHFLAMHFRADFEQAAITRLRTLTADMNRLEGRSRPAFEETICFVTGRNSLPA
ncbi:MAG: hypothetical protein B7Z37_20510 [Verrucomicrobia bacterium 12-59-8]|nr:MAG: hypothetical protein B7Z37_20510 [Verrucomicrobia bacterium 12-59-8]